MSPAKASSGNRGAAGRKHLRVLLPFTCDTLRIPDELAADIAAEEASVVAPFGEGRVRRVAVGQDGDGACLGRGWAEFADACGVDLGWLVVLRHHGGGLLTVKAFDASYCLREFATRPPAPAESMSSTDASSRRPQFISALARNSKENLPIPAKFVQNYIPKGHMNNRIAILLGPLGKISQVELKMNGPDTFFSGGWSQFLALHGITEANSLLLRYEGNMTFTVKVFGSEGCQIESKQNGIRMQQISTLLDIEKQQELPFSSIHKCSEEKKKQKSSMTSLNKAPSLNRSFYEIGPPSWIKKVINTATLKNHLSLAKDFCNAVGLREPCIITLKTSMDSTESWQVRGRTSENCSYMISNGWKRFCQENSLKEGDMCTFYVIEAALWHVVITRCEEKANLSCYQETPSMASNKRKSDSHISSSEEQKGPNGPMTSSNKASSNKRCAFGIWPPSWIKKEINTSTIENVFSLPLAFREALGLREPCTITLKTSMSSTTFWQVRVVPYKYCSHLGGSGWRRFCQDNRIKEGDVCTFNVIDTNLWHVVIAHQ